MLTTDCKFLENELMDVVRLFEKRPTSICHFFRFLDGVFYNDFTVDGTLYSFQDKGQVCDEIIYKRLERRYAKLALYRILSNLSREKMPWGALTGIRPTKLAYMEKQAGRDYHKLFEDMQVSQENVKLVDDILAAQKGIYQTGKGADLFISIPFCPTKCAYCSFITAPIDRTRPFLAPYLDCLEQELLSVAPLCDDLRSIYVGGGTPFVLNESELERVLRATAPLVKSGIEYTVEAGRPDVFTDEKLKLLKDYGVNRICINPQSFSDETLRKIGRKHTVEDVYKAFELSKKYGFIVNVDLIAGLEDEDVDIFKSSVEQAVQTGADNITVHCLSLKSGAKLKEEFSRVENGFVADMVAVSREILSNAGYVPYYMYRQKYQAGNNENVGWTKPGKACVYNIDVMEETTDNIAIGANAVSKRVFDGGARIERFATQKDLKTYMEKLSETMENRLKFFAKNG